MAAAALAVLLMSAPPLPGSPAPVASSPAVPDPAADLDRTVATAEASLRSGDAAGAERHYRAALSEGWWLMGTLELAEDRVAEAATALGRASSSGGDGRALRWLAVAHLRKGETAAAVDLLTRLARQEAGDLDVRRLLAQALVANGQAEQAVRELEEARLQAPGDLELAFALAGGFLRLKQPDAAARLFDEIVEARPIAATHVLIGRTYLDFGEHVRARAALTAALARDPRVRRAHYYLGKAIVAESGLTLLDDAIAAFRAELELAPSDPLASVELGMALVEARRPVEALPVLSRAAGAEPPQARAVYYLGRCLLALDRPREAVDTLKRALDLAQREKAGDLQLGGLHNQLGQAYRKLGAAAEAAEHFAEAERMSDRGTVASRERLARYLGDDPDPQIGASAAAPLIASSPVASLSPAARGELRRRIKAALARSSMNLGVLRVQQQDFTGAALLLADAAEIDPAFPDVQYALGVARFNAQQFDKAVEPLSKALDAGHSAPDLRRMLALTLFNTEAYAKAADLLALDPAVSSDPSVQFTYAVALVRSNRAAAAQPVFARLLSRHGDTPELSVVVGEAYIQQGDFEAAIQSLKRALEVKPDVAGANATLGVVYLKQGRLEEAEAALRAELKAHPGHVQAQHHLAAVLEMSGRAQEAVPLLRATLDAKPDLPEARYLLGKILLAQGTAPEAAQHLEAAVRLLPEDASARYQLAQAYRQLGRANEAEREFEAYRQLKDKRRGSTP